MKIISTPSTQRALTKTDVLIVVATIALLAAVFLPVLNRSRAKSSLVTCVNNLKQVGLGLRISGNHDSFPWIYPTNANEGTLEYAATSQVFRHFQFASNELGETKILICPNDRTRTKAKNWSSLNNSNLSYFIGLDAEEDRPYTILSGDRTISTNGNLMPGVWQVSSNGPVVWAKGIHPGAGNIGLSDGSVQQATSAALQLQLQKGGQATNRFAVP